MRLLKLKQFGLVLCCLVSLFMPSIAAACACRHETACAAHCRSKHQSLQERSCEHPQHHDDNAGAVADSSESFQTVITQPDCCCISYSTPRAFAKANTVKIEKQIALSIKPTRIEFETTQQIVSIKTVVFEVPFYLSDSFYNISPGRAPPRL